MGTGDISTYPSDRNVVLLTHTEKRAMPTLKQLRELAMLTPDEVAKACGVTRQSVWKWEHGIAKPSIPIRRKLVEIFGVSPSELIQAIEESGKTPDRAAA